MFRKVVFVLSLAVLVASPAFSADVSSLVQQGSKLAEQGQWTEAAKMMEKAVQTEPRDARARYWLGRCREVQKNYDEALDQYRKAVILDPKEARSYRGMARVQSAQKNFDDALISYDKALKIDKGDDESRLGMAGVYERQGRDKEALEQYKGLLKTGTRLKADTLVRAGLLAQKLGKTNDAQKFLDEASQLKPNDPVVLNGLGEIALAKNEYDAAISYFTRALVTDPRLHSAYAN